MVSKDNYFYPDPDNTIISIYIENNEPYQGYWQKSEKYVLSSFEELLKYKKFNNILDVGGGAGRILNNYKDYFEKITFVEPDENMLSRAKKRLHDHKGVTYINDTFLNSNISQNSFDIILCSYVLSFITPHNLNSFINKMYKSLKPGGYLVLLTTHSRQKESYYIKTFIDYHKIRSKKISEKKFVSLRTNDETTLPQQLFSVTDLKSLFSSFKIMDLKIFHITNNHKFLDKIIFRDKLYNSLPNRNRFGTNVFMLLKKPKKVMSY